MTAALGSGSEPVPSLPQPRPRAGRVPLDPGHSAPSPFEATRQPASGAPGLRICTPQPAHRNAKTGRAKCRECGETIGKGGLRFGTESNYRGNLTMEWRHADCLLVDLAEAQLTALTGWDTLSDQVCSLALAVARAPQQVAHGGFIYSRPL